MRKSINSFVESLHSNVRNVCSLHRAAAIHSWYSVVEYSEPVNHLYAVSRPNTLVCHSIRFRVLISLAICFIYPGDVSVRVR